MSMSESDAQAWAEILRNEVRSLKMTVIHLTTLADRLDPPPSLPEPNRSSHSS